MADHHHKDHCEVYFLRGATVLDDIKQILIVSYELLLDLLFIINEFMVLALILFWRSSSLFALSIKRLQLLIEQLLILLFDINNTQEAKSNPQTNTDHC